MVVFGLGSVAVDEPLVVVSFFEDVYINAPVGW